MENFGPKTLEKEYKEYLNEYVTLTILPQGQTNYGVLKSFEKRKAVLNPYRGDALNNGKLENCLLNENLTIELTGLNIKIEKISKEVIEKWCELETIGYSIRESEMMEKYKTLTEEKDISKK